MVIDVDSLHGRRADNRWDRMSVGDILWRMSTSEPDGLAIIAAADAIRDAAHARLTFGQADRLANKVANRLLDMGLERSDRVALLCDNSPEAYVSKLAIAKAGLVALPINPMMAPDVIEKMLGFVGCSTAIVDPSLWARVGSAFRAAGVEPAAAICAESEQVDEIPHWSDWVSPADTEEPDVIIHGDDIWEILLTSGTTAMPKAVMISHAYTHLAAMSYALSYARGLRFDSDVRTITHLPMIHHIADHGCVLPALMSGGSVVLGREYTPQSVARSVTKERPTGLWGGAPQFLRDLVTAVDADPSLDLTSLTTIIFGWSAMPPELLDDLKRQCGGEVTALGVFGQTEANACHRFWPDKWRDLFLAAPHTNYVGVPSPMLGADVVDPDGNSLRDQPGVPGEAVYRSPVMAAGYFRDPEATQTAFKDGWFHSGDSCTYGETGIRIMVDRYKDIVKSGGENVSSLRVEGVLVTHPAVARAAVIGVPHEKWGEAVTAVVVPTEGGVIDPEEIIAFARARLAGFETPKKVIVIDELPTTIGGKILKYKLRETLAKTLPGAQS